MTWNFSLNFVFVQFFVYSIDTVTDRSGNFFLCIPQNILHHLTLNLACNKFHPAISGVDRTNVTLCQCMYVQEHL